MPTQVCEIRGDEGLVPKHLISMEVEHSINSNTFMDYCVNLEMWLSDNCSGSWKMLICRDSVYSFPCRVEVGFDNDQDAVLFKIGYCWADKISTVTNFMNS